MECWTASPDLDPGERVLPSAAGTDPTPFLIPRTQLEPFLYKPDLPLMCHGLMKYTVR